MKDLTLFIFDLFSLFSSFSVWFSLRLAPLFRSWCRLSFRGTGRVLCVICPHIVLPIFYLPVLWQDHLPSVICGQRQIKWHGVGPAGSVVPPKYCGQKTGPWIMVGVDGMIVGNMQWPWNLIGFSGWFSTLLSVHWNIWKLLLSFLLSLSNCACISYST